MIKTACVLARSVCLSYAGLMMIRKIKPQRVDTKIQTKLRQSDFIQTLDPSFYTPQKPIQTQQPNPKSTQPQHQHTNTPTRPHPHPSLTQSSPHNSNSLLLTKPQQNPLKQSTKAQLQVALGSLGKALDPINTKQLKSTSIEDVSIKQNKQIQMAIADMKKLKLKDFSILIHRLLVNSMGLNNTVNKYFWKQIQEDFLARFQVTKDKNTIRSYSKIIYCLAKSKAHKDTSNSTLSTSLTTDLQSFQTKFALLLPSATNQSFTMIITSLSRLGPLSQQFCYITQRLYYSRYNQFKPRERVQINYALTRNNKMVDSKLHTYIDSMNLKEIVIMLRCYQNCGVLFTGLKNGINQGQNVQETSLNEENYGIEILAKAQKNIILRKKQMNLIDISDICSLYFEAICAGYYVTKDFQKMLTEMYQLLKHNMNEVAFQKIWRDLPTVVNKGFLQVQFVEEVIKTLRIMHKKRLFPERIWKPMRQNFKKFHNLQIRSRLQQMK